MPNKTIVQKLFLKEGQTFLLLDPPEGYLALLGDLAPRLKTALKPKGILWVTYPKGKTDLNRDILREIVIRFGLETIALFSTNRSMLFS